MLRTAASRLLARATPAPSPAASLRPMSGLDDLSAKEQAEEAIWVRKQETAKLAALAAKLSALSSKSPTAETAKVAKKDLKAQLESHGITVSDRALGMLAELGDEISIKDDKK